MGGTFANQMMFGYADALYYEDADGAPATPPSNQIENPNPQAGSNNFYTQDGYGGGSYTNCSDSAQPGVAPIISYLTALGVNRRCAPHAYYLLNNYVPSRQGLLSMSRYRPQRRKSAPASSVIPQPGKALSHRVLGGSSGRGHCLRPSGYARVQIRGRRCRRHHRLSKVHPGTLEQLPARAALGRWSKRACRYCASRRGRQVRRCGLATAARPNHPWRGSSSSRATPQFACVDREVLLQQQAAHLLVVQQPFVSSL
jgi:hypothetical protein